MVELCLRSVLVYGRCVQSLLELLFTGMKDGEFLQCFFHLKQESASCDIGLSNTPKHAASFSLDQWDLSTKLCLKDLACTSKIMNLT